MKGGVGMGAAFVKVFQKLVLLQMDFKLELFFSPVELLDYQARRRLLTMPAQ